MLIDLSVALHNQTPTYPGDPPIQITQKGSVAADGYVGHALALGTHSGTHIDAPAHMINGAQTLDKIPLDQFVGTGKLIETLSVDALTRIEPGDIVLFHTGASDRFYEPSYFTDFPSLPELVVDHLILKKVAMVGLDTCSADNQPEFPVHKKLLGAGIPIIENLTNLRMLRGQLFTVYALPLKLSLDGAPARVVAQIEEYHG